MQAQLLQAGVMPRITTTTPRDSLVAPLIGEEQRQKAFLFLPMGL